MARKALAAYLASSAELGADKYDRCIAECEGLIKMLQDFATLLIIAANKDTIGMSKIANGRALAQEFGI